MSPETPIKRSSTPTVVGSVRELPPVLAGSATPQVVRRVESFYGSVAELFERWVARRASEQGMSRSLLN